MSVTTQQQHSQADVFNLPNQVTSARLLLSIVLFVLIDLQFFLTSCVLFVVAASTDWLDGYFARKYGMITVLGRILDPFVDKVIVCGSFIFLVVLPESGIAAWMAVIVVARELLVTALRSFLEQQGADFSASMTGKLKMVMQCVAVAVSLYFISYMRTNHLANMSDAPAWLWWTLQLSVYTAVILTVLSGVVYVRAAIRLVRIPEHSPEQ